jgi:hypothetical protein
LKELDILDNEKTQFALQVDMVKEFGRLLQKASYRLYSVHKSELKHQEIQDNKKKVDEEKKRVAEAKSGPKKKKVRKLLRLPVMQPIGLRP